MRGMGWKRGEPSPEPADEAGGAKHQLNAGSLALQGEGEGGSSRRLHRNSQKALFKKRSQLTNVNTTSFKGLRLSKSFVA